MQPNNISQLPAAPQLSASLASSRDPSQTTPSSSMPTDSLTNDSLPMTWSIASQHNAIVHNNTAHQDNLMFHQQLPATTSQASLAHGNPSQQRFDMATLIQRFAGEDILTSAFGINTATQAMPIINNASIAVPPIIPPADLFLPYVDQQILSQLANRNHTSSTALLMPFTGSLVIVQFRILLYSSCKAPSPATHHPAFKFEGFHHRPNRLYMGTHAVHPPGDSLQAPARGMPAMTPACTVSAGGRLRPVPATISTSPSDKTVNEGKNSVKLQCEATGKPNIITYTWKKDSDDITIGGRYSLNGGSLIITNIVRSDYGIYTCRASNSIGEGTSDSATLNVKFAPVSANLAGNINTVVMGDDVMLTCTTTTSNPPAAISWYRWTDLLSNSDDNIRIVVIEDIDGDYNGKISKQQLTITTTVQDNQADFKCVARNPIIGGDINSNSVTNTVYFPPRYPNGCNTQLLGYPDNTGHVVAGETLKLTCISCSSNPKAELEWYQNKKMIASGFSDVSYQDNVHYGNTTTQDLTIELSYHHHNDLIYCEASNIYFITKEVSNTVTLNVYYGAFVVNKEINEQSAADESEPAELRCEINSNPPSIVHWYGPDGDIINGGYNKTIKESSNFTKQQNILIINSTRRSDHGNYTCNIDNGIGSINFTVELKGKNAPPTSGNVSAGSEKMAIGMYMGPIFAVLILTAVVIVFIIVRKRRHELNKDQIELPERSYEIISGTSQDTGRLQPGNDILNYEDNTPHKEKINVEESAYATLSLNETEHIYMKTGKKMVEFQRDHVSMKTVIHNGQIYKINISDVWSIAGIHGNSEVAIKYSSGKLGHRVVRKCKDMKMFTLNIKYKIRFSFSCFMMTI
ncbi:uncharacterized protein LOC144344484 [Saccoglossus kowalevskii]